MISDDFLQILRCPINRSPLALAEEDLLARLNRAIQEGRIQNRGGDPVSQKLEEALVDEDRRVLYPVFDGIPCLLADEAIMLSRLDDSVKDDPVKDDSVKDDSAQDEAGPG